MSKFKSKPILGLILLLVVLYVFQSTIRPKPDYNWDAVPYMNLVLAFDGVEDDSIRHQQTYAKLKDEVPEEHWKLLAVTEHWYRYRNYESHEVATETLPFYSIKPLFILNCWFFYKIGFGLYDSTWIPSFLTYFLIGILFYLYIGARKNYVIGLFATLLIMLTPIFLELSILSTPDALGTLTMIMLTIMYLEKRSIWWILVMSIFSILIRPDHLIICGFIFCLKAIEEKELNFAYHGNPGWKVLFMHSFQGNIHYPVSGIENRTWEWGEYIKTMKSHYHTVSFFLWVMLFPLLILLPSKIKLPDLFKRRDFLLFLAIIIATLLKFMLFPYTIDRYYAPFYASAIILIVYAGSKLEIRVNENQT
jgi:hypothetical protein